MKMVMDDIGEVTFVKNSRSKNLRITVKPFEGIKVTLPDALSFKSAISFVYEKKDWIKKSVGNVKKIEDSAIIFDENSGFHTKYHTLKIQTHDKEDCRGFTKGGVFYFFYPRHREVTSKSVQDRIKTGIIWLLRKEARSYLPFRVMHLAEKHGFTYQKVFVKNLKSRWGSCSHVNNINLNIHLMRLPDHLIDYVILHELVHTVHKNHGKMFWKMLDELCGDARNLRKQMGNYRIIF